MYVDIITLPLPKKYLQATILAYLFFSLLSGTKATSLEYVWLVSKV